VGAIATEPLLLLLDTVAFILWHADSPRLPDSVRVLLHQAPVRPVYVSAASAFEIATRVRLGKLHVPQVILQDFQYVVEADGFRLLDVSAIAAVRAGLLPSEHRDPFDRLIAAQALDLGATVATSDSAFQELGVTVVW
jgi:PIN domain nuclease of toxin-antitoxin system